MGRKAGIFAIALLASPAAALAQTTGSSGPSSAATAASNAAAAAAATRAGDVPPASGTSVLIGSPAQSDNCALPISVGYGSIFLGATIVWNRGPETCWKLRRFWALHVDDATAARELLCDFADVRAARKRARVPCAVDAGAK